MALTSPLPSSVPFQLNSVPMMSSGARRRRRKRRRTILSITTGTLLAVAGVCDVREESLTPPIHEPAISEILRLGGGAKSLSDGNHPHRRLAQDDIWRGLDVT